MSSCWLTLNAVSTQGPRPPSHCESVQQSCPFITVALWECTEKLAWMARLFSELTIPLPRQLYDHPFLLLGCFGSCWTWGHMVPGSGCCSLTLCIQHCLQWNPVKPRGGILSPQLWLASRPEVLEKHARWFSWHRHPHGASCEVPVIRGSCVVPFSSYCTQIQILNVTYRSILI